MIQNTFGKYRSNEVALKRLSNGEISIKQALSKCGSKKAQREFDQLFKHRADRVRLVGRDVITEWRFGGRLFKVVWNLYEESISYSITYENTTWSVGFWGFTAKGRMYGGGLCLW